MGKDLVSETIGCFLDIKQNGGEVPCGVYVSGKDKSAVHDIIQGFRESDIAAEPLGNVDPHSVYHIDLDALS